MNYKQVKAQLSLWKSAAAIINTRQTQVCPNHFTQSWYWFHAALSWHWITLNNFVFILRF